MITTRPNAYLNAPAEKRNHSHALQETFWARRLGVLTDQFGIPWDINCEKPELVRRAIR